jgi:putative glycosyltransferase (TIGR04372 family)
MFLRANKLIGLYLAQLKAWIYSSEAHILLQAGQALALLERHEDALEYYKKALVLGLQPDASRAEVCMRIGHELMLGNHLKDSLEDAVRHHDIALELMPNKPEYWVQAGQALALLERHEDALEHYKKALGLGLQPDASRAEVCMRIGHELMLGNYLKDSLEDAVRHHDLALELMPNKPEYWMQAGMVFRVKGDYDKATKYWGRAIAVRRDLAENRGLNSRGVRFLGSTWLHSIGHLGPLDFYIKMGLLGLRPKQKTFLLLPPGLKVPNLFLLNQWRRYIDIISDPTELGLSSEEVELLTDDYYAAMFPDGLTRVWYLSGGATIQEKWETEKRSPLLSLSVTDLARGKACLNQLGLPPHAWYVCLHVREPGFWKQDEEHPTTRDADIKSYCQAIRSITKRGGWVIRMGNPGMKRLPSMEHVVDYAHSPFRSDWMDVFLWGSCRFFIATQSGPAFIPQTFGVPCALTNWSPMVIFPWYRNDIWIPKLYWSEKEGRHLKFEEVYSSGFASKEYMQELESQDITVVNNSADEINDLILEMLERVSNVIDYTNDDENRQSRFDLLMDKQNLPRTPRLGRDFLRKHEALLYDNCPLKPP